MPTDVARDHERSLAGRGRRAARALAELIRRRALTPELVLCSTSVRTRETLEFVRQGFGDPPTVVFETALYLAESASLTARLRKVEADVSSVLLIGHNPGLQDLALALAPPSSPLRARIASKFPTCALAILGISGEWDQIGPARATLLDYVTPDDLAAGLADS